MAKTKATKKAAKKTATKKATGNPDFIWRRIPGSRTRIKVRTAFTWRGTRYTSPIKMREAIFVGGRAAANAFYARRDGDRATRWARDLITWQGKKGRTAMRRLEERLPGASRGF